MGCVAIAAIALSARADDFQGATHMMPFEEEPIDYNHAAATGAVAQLQKRIDTGATALKHDEAYGYLLALLDELKVPKSSQMLVFSKTSLQRHRINPRTPRAIYFGDDAYVGSCQKGDILEVTAVDPQLGSVFYSLSQKKTDKPQFKRQTDN